MNELIGKVTAWSEARKIINGSTPIKQHDKLVEEVLEIRDAIVALNTKKEVEYGFTDKEQAEIRDGIGDSVVCLINLATMFGWTLEECLQEAHEEIKDRKGLMINQTFVKYADLTDEQKKQVDKEQ